MTKNPSRRDFSAGALATIAASTLPAPYVWAAEKKYDAGASDTEIKLGQTIPHSGPGSLYGVLGRVGEDRPLAERKYTIYTRRQLPDVPVIVIRPHKRHVVRHP